MCTSVPLTLHQDNVLGIQKASKILEAQCNVLHLVEQSQLPDNQSPHCSEEDEKKPQEL